MYDISPGATAVAEAEAALAKAGLLSTAAADVAAQLGAPPGASPGVSLGASATGPAIKEDGTEVITASTSPQLNQARDTRSGQQGRSSARGKPRRGKPASKRKPQPRDAAAVLIQRKYRSHRGVTDGEYAGMAMQGSAALGLRRGSPREGRPLSALSSSSSSPSRYHSHHYGFPAFDPPHPSLAAARIVRIAPLPTSSPPARPKASSFHPPTAPPEPIWPPVRRSTALRNAQQYPNNWKLRQIHEVYGQYIGSAHHPRESDMRPRGVYLQGGLFVLPASNQASAALPQLPSSRQGGPQYGGTLSKLRPTRPTTAPARGATQVARQPIAPPGGGVQAWAAPNGNGTPGAY